jgi:flagellar basal-body rod modification protein FlgD
MTPGSSPGVTPPVVSAATGTPTALRQTTGSGATLAENFTAFLQLLTTQLRNQNPLEPLDTNQFTQQLVQFAQVEQQLKSNDQLASLVAIQKSAQASTALGFVGRRVAVDGTTARLADGSATWGFAVDKPATATIAIHAANGQLAYSGEFAIQPGRQSFVWDGRDMAGNPWPPGNYTISVTARDASGQPLAVSTEIEGVVDAADLTQTPPQLAIGGQSFGIDQIRRVVR